MDGCVFCKIIKGEIPSAKIYEDDDFIVILDRYPSCAGHTLVVPKEHAGAVFDLSDEAAAKLFPLLKTFASKINSALKPDGINILQNNGAAAGQSVPHFHVHIIPRFQGDNVTVGWGQQDPSPEEFEETAKKISLA